MNILGLSAFYHDSAAALLRDGHIVAAAQEERFSRVKHDQSYPRSAVDFCLERGELSAADLDAVVFYDKPFVKFERLLETYLAFAPRGFRSFAQAMPLWIKDKLFQKKQILNQLKSLDPRLDWSSRLLFSEHHMSHAASAFYPSPFEQAAILVLDGVGEWATSTLALGEGSDIRIEREINFPHSLGLLYSAFTQYTGFKVNSGEYKLMGLAPYGKPKYESLILDHLLDLKDDGSFRLNMDYFSYCTDLQMVNQRFCKLFGAPVRSSEGELQEFHFDVASSIQAVTEQVLLKMTRYFAAQTGQKNLCLAGGVALNCVANGKILKDGAFENIWIQPAAGDSGGALGAALAAHHQHFKKPATPKKPQADSMNGSYLGPSYSNEQIQGELDFCGARYERLSTAQMIARTAEALISGKAVGWFQGAMEYGPRALGARSILADPRSESMQTILNLKVKFRESFRPFAPSVLKNQASNWFDLKKESPYMLLVAPVALNKRISKGELNSKSGDEPQGLALLKQKRSEIPAVTHVDYSARVQTVDAEVSPLYHQLIESFYEKTGCPVVVNTSFNVRGEPIVCRPTDAFRCFMGTDIEALAIGDFFLMKDDQDPQLRRDYRSQFALD